MAPALGDGPPLWLDSALMSIKRQTLPAVEVIVCLDPGAPALPDRFSDVVTVYGREPGQAHAVNAGAAAAECDVLAFLEDDDQWFPERLERTAAALTGAVGFVSCSQREVDAGHRGFLRVNDYPTPSGWLVQRDVWRAAGGLDTSYRYHVDNAFLGVLAQRHVERLHLFEAGAIENLGGQLKVNRPWLGEVMRHSSVKECPALLVERTDNPLGGMAQIATQDIAAERSRVEHQKLVQRFGGNPW